MLSSRALSTAYRAAAPRAPIAARVAFTRSYAAAAAPSSSNTKPPVALFGIDGTYASALVRYSPLPIGPIPALSPMRGGPNWAHLKFRNR